MPGKSDFRPSYILDTSALIAYLANEKGAEKVNGIRSEASIPFVALSELYYLVWKRKGKAEANKIFGLVKSWQLPVILPDEKIILTAGRYKAVYGLGIADCYIASIAHSTDAVLVTKDEDFQVLKEELRIMPI